MTFDGAFHVPTWLRQLAVQPIDLIAHCRREEGGTYSPPTQGAVALAEWLLADAVRAEREANRPGSPLSMGGVINRLLAGAIVPSDQLAESIGQMTGGKVNLAMFEREASDVPAENALAALPVPDAEPAPRPEPVLGQTAPGPLWTARLKGKRILVSGGLGVDLAMEPSAGARLHATLGAALKKAGMLPAAQA